MWIKGIVNELTEKHGTSDPYEIADIKNIKIIEYDLHHDVLGFYKYIRRNMFIFINMNLDYKEKKFTCSHELGHSQLHPRLSTPFLRRKTLFSIDKIEKEANRFAVELLMTDEQLYEYRDTKLSLEEIAAGFGIPREIAKLKVCNFF